MDGQVVRVTIGELRPNSVKKIISTFLALPLPPSPLIYPHDNPASKAPPFKSGRRDKEGLSSKLQVTQLEPTHLPARVNYRAKKTVKQKSQIVCKPIEMPIGIDIVRAKRTAKEKSPNLNLPRPMEQQPQP